MELPPSKCRFGNPLVAKRTVKLGCKLPIPFARLRLVGSWRLECTLTRFVTWLLSSLEILESDHFRKWTSEIHVEEKHPVFWCKGKTLQKHVVNYFGLPSFFKKNLPFKNIETLDHLKPINIALAPNQKSNEKSKWIFQSSPWEFTAWKAFSPF